jgi:hypothetical protein
MEKVLRKLVTLPIALVRVLILAFNDPGSTYGFAVGGLTLFLAWWIAR